MVPNVDLTFEASMGAIENSKMHRMVFLGENPVSVIRVILRCFDGSGDEPNLYDGNIPRADFPDPFTITNFSVKVITFGAAV